MRHGSSNRRQRSRNNNGRRSGNSGNNGAPNRSQVFDSNGPDVRIRGTAHQIVEKYTALAKDADSSGDYTLAENYRQHAEHYQRILSNWDDIDRQRAEAKQQRESEKAEQEAQNDKDNDDLGLPASVLPTAPVAIEITEGEEEKEIA